MNYATCKSTMGITLSLISLFLLEGKKMPAINELIDITKAELPNNPLGEVFLVRDQLKGFEWNGISCSDRLLHGALFLNNIMIK